MLLLKVSVVVTLPAMVSTAACQAVRLVKIVKASAEDTELSTRVVVKTVAREKDFSRAFDKLCFSSLPAIDKFS